jgi:hypothetical protein
MHGGAFCNRESRPWVCQMEIGGSVGEPTILSLFYCIGSGFRRRAFTPKMSAYGPKQTSLVAPHMSAFGGKADIHADAQKCPLMSQSRAGLLGRARRCNFSDLAVPNEPEQMDEFGR